MITLDNGRITICTIKSSGTESFEKDCVIRGAFLYNPANEAITMEYYPDSENEAGSFVSLFSIIASSNETNSFRHSGFPCAGDGRSQLVFNAGTAATITLYLNRHNIGA